MDRLPYDIYFNLRLLSRNPQLKENPNGLPQEHLFGCLLYYQQCKDSLFKRWYLEVVRKRNPSLNSHLTLAKEAVQHLELVDINEGREVEIVTKTAGESLRSMHIP
jgi:hypothetical protein